MPEDVGFKKVAENETSYGTGAHRDSRVGKGTMKWIPHDALFLVSRIFEKGNLGRGEPGKRGDDRNWENGMPIADLVDSGMRHAASFLAGDRSEPHLSQSIWNLLCAQQMSIWVWKGDRPNELNNLPNHRARWYPGDPPPCPLSPMEIEWLLFRGLKPDTNFTEGQLAYLAAIIDGEGTIAITASGGCYLGYIAIYNTVHSLLQGLKDQFGGGAITQTHPDTKNWAAGYALEWGHYDAVRLIRLILPFLRIKKCQAELILKLHGLKQSGKGSEKMAELKRCCHILNRKGPKGGPTILSPRKQIFDKTKEILLRELADGEPKARAQLMAIVAAELHLPRKVSLRDRLESARKDAGIMSTGVGRGSRWILKECK
jgi:hypothetical protein